MATIKITAGTEVSADWNGGITVNLIGDAYVTATRTGDRWSYTLNGRIYSVSVTEATTVGQ